MCAIFKRLKYRRFIGLVATASIATTLVRMSNLKVLCFDRANMHLQVLIDGPLLQRSSSVRIATLSRTVTLDIALTPGIPRALSGAWDSKFELQVSSKANAVAEAFLHSAPMKTSAECEGTCTATVRGPGIAAENCVHKTWPVTRNMLRASNSTWASAEGKSRR